uniref:Coiled-coil domain-containing protein 86 n=1 Tax=Ciona intestinalis TaxID=7719 RepID=F6VWZ6_CIOIN|nr:coiled-coil domain-containing protein 86-like [Ciona intestinalis]|eukprot:XP_002131726.1 coiled-coil domain-containing protein 86-like [Ciona intestinalis]
MIESVVPNTDATETKIKGLPKSGRWWKAEKSRFTSMQKDKPLRSNWKQKMACKAEKLSVKNYEKELAETRRQEKIEYRKRVEAHRKVKEENQRKAEVVEVIRNTAKIKRLKKKQLRRIEKRDTSGVKTKKM